MRHTMNGPEETTGIFETREELEEKVVEMLVKGLTKNEISDFCNVSTTTVSNIHKLYESGRITNPYVEMKRQILYAKDWTKLTLLS